MYRVLLAISGAEDHESARITDVLESIPMETDEVKITIVNVFEEFEVTDEGATVSSDELYDEAELPEAVERARAALRDRGYEVEVVREHGDPTKKILAVAERIDADLLAMGGRQMTPVGKVIFGSTTQAVMLEAERPVLVTMG